jgi:hypothetical protein
MDVFIGSKVTEIVLTVSTTRKVTKIVGPALEQSHQNCWMPSTSRATAPSTGAHPDTRSPDDTILTIKPVQCA